jgi:hypothetical protein
MPAKKIAYVHQFTGDVKVVTKQEGKKLSEDWQRVQFVKNEEGKQVMRIQLNGAVADISENEEEAKDVVRATE